MIEDREIEYSIPSDPKVMEDIKSGRGLCPLRGPRSKLGYYGNPRDLEELLDIDSRQHIKRRNPKNEAIEILRKFSALCYSHASCYGCPMREAAYDNDSGTKTCDEFIQKYPEQAYRIINEWRIRDEQ